MSDPEPMPPLKNRALAAFLAWLVPGAGHFYQGRYAKGAIYLVCIWGLFLTGLYLGEGKNVYWRWLHPMRDSETFRWSFLCQVWVGVPSALALIQGTLEHLQRPAILGGLMAWPSDLVVNAMHPRLAKLMEVASIYTMVAGLLNLLAIFDAHGGPAAIVSARRDREAEALAQAKADAKPKVDAKPKALPAEARA